MIAFPFRRAMAMLVLSLALAGCASAPSAAQDQPARNGAKLMHLPRPGQSDILIPEMDASRGRIYFATRGCVICHRVNGIGGSLAPSLDINGTREIDVFDFVTRMWRGARSMVALQDSLFSETIDLSPDELADIIAFVYDPAERARFSEKDIPLFVRDYMQKKARSQK